MAQEGASRGFASSGFGELLRGWRHDRRLSQEALAHEAEISQRHLSCLESGRSSPSRQMALHLAHVLDVPLRDRNLMLGAAGFAPAYAHRTLEGPELAAVDQALDLMLGGLEPCPAIAIDRAWNLVRANGAALATFAAFVDLDTVFARIDAPGGGPNMLWLLYHPEGLRPWIRDWQEVGPAMLDRIRREVAADPAWAGGAELLHALQELAGFAPGARAWTPTPDPVLTLTLERDDVRLRLFTMMATFGTAQDVTVQELRVEAFFPADDASRATLEQLRRARAPAAG
ncbi:MAG TPA: helix-turn-helix transcriptional regulator [Pseudomonadales bacterium]|nr:helix-turn-helix transcriptional regulator [Pseudomonadales bacterium]